MPKVDSLQIGIAVAVAVAAAGFFVGTAETHETSSLLWSSAPETGDVEDAPTAASLRVTGNSAGTWADEAERWQAEASDRVRSDNRAYEGAPPTVPHAVDQGSSGECLACHSDGMSVRGHTASPIPHEAYASCTQCHVVSETPLPGEASGAGLADGNTFAGMAPPGPGERAWAGAPPLMPHSTRMRDACDSCHGVAGSSPLVTPHPERQSCTQCHPPSAELEGHAWN